MFTAKAEAERSLAIAYDLAKLQAKMEWRLVYDTAYLQLSRKVHWDIALCIVNISRQWIINKQCLVTG